MKLHHANILWFQSVVQRSASPLLTVAVAIALLWLSLLHHLEPKKVSDPAAARPSAASMSVDLAEEVSHLFIGGTAVLALLLVLLLWEQKRREIRERALAQSNAALAEVEASLRGVFESSPDYLSVLSIGADDEITVEMMNDAMITARDIRRDHRGRQLEEFVPPTVFARARRGILQVVASGEALRVQASVFDDERTCEVIVVPLTFSDESRRATRVFVSIRDITHLRRAETKIAASEARYRLIADNATDMITHLDLTARHLYVSPGSEDLIGYKFEDLVGTSLHEMIHPDDAQQVAAIFADFAAVRCERAVNVNRWRHRDGRWIWVEASLRLLRDAEGEATGVVGVMRNVTERRRTAAALQASEARYRFLAESTSDVITRLSLKDFSREYISPGCRSVFGFEPEEMLGKVPSNSIHPDDALRVRELAKRLVTGQIGEEKITATYRALHKLGHWVWIEGAMSLARDEAGVPLAIVCALRDVTERRRVEAAIEASDARFRLVTENASELIVLGRSDGTRTYISPASERLFGFTPEELAEEMNAKRWVHPDDVDQLAKASLDDTGSTSVVCRVRHKLGAWIWVDAMIRRFAALSADESSVVVSFRDVSEQQGQAEAMRHAKEAAEQANQAKTNFLAVMSHEIRTPLNAVLGYADILLADQDISGARRISLERIQNAGSALRTVVDDILDFSKIEAGQIDLVRRPFNPLSLVDDATSIMRGSAQAKGLDLVIDLGCDVPAEVSGDRDRLRQILLNLLNNAIKFTPSGRVTLSISVLKREQASIRYRFAVQDTGIGIAEEKLGRLFQRFSQIDSSINREFGGTGLGLAICKRLVEAMGGVVGVISAVGQGSTFWFDVPLENLPPAKPSSEPVFQAEVQRRASILLVEDVELNRDLACAVLEHAGHVVDTVENGAAALTAALAKRYDVILMDVQMPVMDGIEATRRIRAFAHPARTTPVIAMSANVLPDQIAEFLASGMDGHVGKPFRREDLLAEVARWTTSKEPAARQVLRPALDREPVQGLPSLAGSEK